MASGALCVLNGEHESAVRETESVFAEYRDSLIRYLRYHMDDSSEAEDIAQETFVRFYQLRIRDEEILQPRAWLFRVAHNLLVDRGRKKKPELLDDEAWMSMERRLVSPSAPPDAKVYVSQLPWHRLSPMELECLRLRTEGLKLREIGEVLDLAISTVVSYLARATKKLGAVEVSENSASQHGRTPTPV